MVGRRDGCNEDTTNGADIPNATVRMVNSTLSGNNYVGAYIACGSMNIYDSTVSYNRHSNILLADSFQGQRNSIVRITNSIVANALQRSGLRRSADILVINDFGTFSCNDNRLGRPTLAAVVATDKFSIIEDGSCGTRARAIDPGLEELADNGGPTQTHALRADSAARDSGGGCFLEDQRGSPRDIHACDVGAFESQGLLGLPFYPQPLPLSVSQ